MGIINFIIDNILTQASITIALIAMLGLLLQKKSAGQVISGSLKTLLGFQVLSAGSSIIVGSLTYFGEIFTEGFDMQGIIPSIEAINGQAMNELGLGRDIALTFLAIFVFNILLARFTKWKYIFLTGQAILWMATMTTVFGYFAGLRGVVLILVGGLIGAIFAVAMPAMAQPIIRKVTGSDDIAPDISVRSATSLKQALPICLEKEARRKNRSKTSNCHVLLNFYKIPIFLSWS